METPINKKNYSKKLNVTWLFISTQFFENNLRIQQRMENQLFREVGMSSRLPSASGSSCQQSEHLAILLKYKCSSLETSARVSYVLLVIAGLGQSG